MKTRNLIICTFIMLLVITSISFADLPIVPGFNIEIYAELTQPQNLCFSPDGVMYLGNRTHTSADSIYRIEPGGGPGSVSLYGPTLWKPCSTGYDKDGLISGTPGTIIAAGGMGSSSHITAIFPDQTTKMLWGGSFDNVGGGIEFDSTGRMLLLEHFKLLYSHNHMIQTIPLHRWQLPSQVHWQ